MKRYLAMLVAITWSTLPVLSAQSAPWRPVPGTTWQWQLTGALDTSVGAQVFDIDGFNSDSATVAALHAQGRRVICYIEVGGKEGFRPDANLFPASIVGTSNGFADDYWVDIRSPALKPIVEARMDMCKAKGFDAIEPDLMDAYQNNTGFPITASDQLTFNRWVASAAHARGLSVGLKGDIGQAVALEPDFDWTLNEQCFQYNECAGLQAFVKAGKAAFVAEYQGSPAEFCPKANAQRLSAMLKHLVLDAYRVPCWTGDGPVATPAPGSPGVTPPAPSPGSPTSGGPSNPGTSAQGGTRPAKSAPGSASAKRKCTVPALKGLTTAAARKLLVRSGCALGGVTAVNARPANRGRVVAQSVRPGKRLTRRASVAVSVGRTA